MADKDIELSEEQLISEMEEFKKQSQTPWQNFCDKWEKAPNGIGIIFKLLKKPVRAIFVIVAILIAGYIYLAAKGV